HGVLTRPARPAGRGRDVRPSAVARAAGDLGLSVLKPERVSQPEVLDAVRAWHPDAVVVVAFGQILPAEFLKLPGIGAINVHASLLPRWRGAAPIQAAILHGDSETGVTLMMMDAGLDTGPILDLARTEIREDETAAELSDRLAERGASLLTTSLPRIAAGEITPRPQPDTGVTLAPRLRKGQGRLDFKTAATQLVRQVRAFEPWPSSFFEWDGNRVIVRRASVGPELGLPAGRTSTIDEKPAVAAASGSLILEALQVGGRKVTLGSQFLRGAPAFVGVDLTPSPPTLPQPKSDPP
ncbi:MAG: methionyl-tRNA formyltransferase, partial [Anaerolineales bacterium]